MARIDELKKQNPELDISLLDIIVSVDPTKTYKYAQFLIKTIKSIINPNEIVKVISEGMFGEDRIKLLNQFEEHCKANRIKNSDISSYKNWEEINVSVKSADEILKQKELEKQVVKLHEDDEWLIVIPQTFEASKTYGSNTKWCTTQLTHWNSYFPNYKLIYIINKVANKKYAISRKYDDDAKIQAWLSDDKETSPMMVPLPDNLMLIVITEVRKQKGELDLSRLDPGSIFCENGMIVPISEATNTQLIRFKKKYGNLIPLMVMESIDAAINKNNQKSIPNKTGIDDFEFKEIDDYLKLFKNSEYGKYSYILNDILKYK
jgi:hypothetical protein